MRKLKNGCVHIYTGDGKGKTTASIGLALRAASSGLKVCMYQFLKSAGSSAENWLKFPNFRVVCLDQKHPLFGAAQSVKNKATRGLEANILKELAKIKRTMKAGKYDVIILDEIVNCVSEGFIGVKDVLTVIKARPKRVELVLTGRSAPGELVAAADYVTDLRKVKHPFDKGVRCRKGIEY